jgi:lipid-A-disaccharide synthase
MNPTSSPKEAVPATRGAVLFTAFEPSGDALAAPLIERLGEYRKDLKIYAWGGPRMEAAGATIVGATSQDGSMGLGALAHAREVNKTIKSIGRWIKGSRLVLHVPVDAPAANFPVCKHAREAGARIVHLAAPQLWAWGEGRIKKLRRLTDHLMCLLPFEPQWFGERGVKGTFVGHPAVNRSLDPAALKAAAGALAPGGPRLLILPGSRSQELKRNLPLMLRTWDGIRQRHGRAVAIIAAATPEIASHIRSLDLPTNTRVMSDRLDEAIAWADVALACSGTVTLNLLRQCCPMVGVWKASCVSCLGAKIMLKTEHRLLPNIIANERIVPERVPYCGGAEPLVKEILYLLEDSRRLEAQRAALRTTLAKFKGPVFASACLEAIESTIGTNVERR